MGQSSTMSKQTGLRFPPKTVEHPFDTDFLPAQPDSDWAKLAHVEDEEYALLLCTYSDEEWLVWLPSRGETVLNNNQLCFAA